MPIVPLDSGHFVHASHLERPVTEFRVEFDDPGYLHILAFEGGTRWVRALAETPDGALKVARYHYGLRCSHFVLGEERKA
jgi:hypothetical protein